MRGPQVYSAYIGYFQVYNIPWYVSQLLHEMARGLIGETNGQVRTVMGTVF